jgi:hypothetical protein
MFGNKINQLKAVTIQYLQLVNQVSTKDWPLQLFVITDFQLKQVVLVHCLAA